MRLTLAVLAAASLTLAACSGSSGSADSPSPAPTSATASPTSASPTAAEGWAVSDCAVIAPPEIQPEPPADAALEGPIAVTESQVPSLAIEAGATPATDLVAIDLVEGEGTAVEAGATVTIDYCGAGLTTRTIFDSSWSRGEPATFPLDALIAGWQEGIPGMKPGGRRLLIIPGALGYGPNPPTPDILPDETLVFVVDLISSP